MKRMLVILVVLIAFRVDAQVKPVRTLFLYDANGKKVGGVQSMSEQLNSVTVSLKLNGVVLALEATSQQLAGVDDRFLLFQSPDCSGQPMIDASVNILTPVITVVGPTRTVYVGTGQATLFAWASHLNNQSGACVPVPPQTPTDVFPAQIIGDLGAFTPPFTVR